MNLITWKHQLITTYEEAKEVIQFYKSRLKAGAVRASGFDTETTGLHPVLDKPFLFISGWLEGSLGYVYIVDIEENSNVARWFITNWNNMTEHTPIYLGHHTIFDQHMLENIGLRYKRWDNLSDTQFYIRASSDAVQQDKGGEPLALKDWAVRHISVDANKYEKNLKALRTAEAKKYNAALKDALGCTKKKIDEFFKDKVNDVDDLPAEWHDKYLSWYNSLPDYLQLQVTGTVESDMIRYDKISRADVIEYAFFDVEYTLTCWAMCDPVVKVRDNYEQIRRENLAMQDFYMMERVGFKVDKEYIAQSRVKTKEYLLKRRKDLCILAGEPLKCGQHDAIKRILLNKYGIAMDSVGKEELEKVLGNLRRMYPDAEVIEFIETIQELRTLEKWYSTYICKFDRQLRRSDRIYTSINQCGAVSGRISCDFQQFPKEGLVDMEGNELFNPRQMVIVDKEAGYDSIFYLDYSAQELRIQALWTYLIGSPDIGMLRAYSPYNCHDETGRKWNPEGCLKPKEVFEHKWYQDEDNKEWVPTDLHGLMTHSVYPELSEDDPSWHDKRYIGKRANFAKNYGASYTRIRDMFYWLSDEECHAIDEGYYKAFPGVKEYHQFCFNIAKEPFAENLYGVKYYGVGGHNLRNMLVQGSAAYMTKEQTRKANTYLAEHGYKSRIIIPIHDELQFEHHKDDPIEIMFELKNIMQDIDSQVPIVSDLEVTTTDWKHKVEINNIEELRRLLYEQEQEHNN